MWLFLDWEIDNITITIHDIWNGLYSYGLNNVTFYDYPLFAFTSQIMVKKQEPNNVYANNLLQLVGGGMNATLHTAVMGDDLVIPFLFLHSFQSILIYLFIPSFPFFTPQNTIAFNQTFGYVGETGDTYLPFIFSPMLTLDDLKDLTMHTEEQLY